MKHQFRRLRRMRGFSIVELMVVVSIIGILAAVAMPKFKRLQARAKGAEAKSSLSHIYTLEADYYGVNTTYGTHSQIGWADPTNKNYTCTVPGPTQTTYTAQCVADANKVCAAGETHSMTQDKTFTVSATNCVNAD